jgi:hypothetical protein
MPQEIFVGKVKFDHPEWVIQGPLEPYFTEAGASFVENILKEVAKGNRIAKHWDTFRGLGYDTIRYSGKYSRAENGHLFPREPRLLLFLISEPTGIYLYIYVERFVVVEPLELSEEEQKFLVAFTKALGKALPVKSGKMNVLTKPRLPIVATRFQSLPPELEEEVREMAAEVKQKNNPLMKLTGGKKTRRMKRKAKKTRRA